MATVKKTADGKTVITGGISFPRDAALVLAINNVSPETFPIKVIETKPFLANDQPKVHIIAAKSTVLADQEKPPIVEAAAPVKKEKTAGILDKILHSKKKKK